MSKLKTILLAGAVAAAPMAAVAGPASEPGVFGGLVWNFGGGAGVTLKAYATNQPGTANIAAGVTYYFDGSFGADIGIVYYDACGIGDLAFSLGYDFLQSGVQAGVGMMSNSWLCF